MGIKHLLVITGAIISAGCSLVGIRTTPEPPYTVEASDPPFELRHYPPMVVASTIVNGDFESAGNKAFRVLFHYISGNNNTQETIDMTSPVLTSNEPGQRIAMTAPVIGIESQGRWEYQFVLPEHFSVESAPRPGNGDIEIKETKERLMATIRFSGLWREASKNRHQQKLQEWIEKHGYTIIGNPVIAGYDPPWTLPFFRRNEVLIEVSD